MNQDLERTEELLGKTKKKVKKKTGIIIIAIAAIIAAGVGVFIGVSGSNSGQVEEKLKLADKLLTEGKYEQAITAYNEVIEIDDKSAKAYEGLGDAYVGSKQYKKSVKPYKKAIENDNQNDKLYEKVITTAVKNDDKDTAKDVIDIWNKNKPSDKKRVLDDYVKDLIAYQKVLNTLYDENRLDAEGYLDSDIDFLWIEMDYDKAENRFAIADVDGDGENELLFEANTTYGVHMYTHVMKYDAKRDKVKYIAAFFHPEFYADGIAEGGFSHMPSPGIGGIIYGKYDKKAGEWKTQHLLELDEEYYVSYDDDDKFPKSADKNGNGTVYRLCEPIGDGATKEIDVMDDDQYKKWYKKTFSTAKLKIDYKDFTKENIKRITATNNTSEKTTKKKPKKGQQTVKGVVQATTYGERADDVGMVWSGSDADDRMVLLLLNEETEITAERIDEPGVHKRVIDTMTIPESFEQYDGKTVEIAFGTDGYYYSDVTGALSNVNYSDAKVDVLSVE